MTKEKMYKFLIKKGFNEEALKELSTKELYRMFIVCLCFVIYGD